LCLDYYVYGHINPITKKFFYIGKGTGERLTDTEGRNAFWRNTVNKYGFAAIKIVDGLSDAEALEIERQYIEKHKLRRDGGDLVNLTYGGRGGRTIFEHNIESVRNKCRESKLGEKNPNYGKHTWNYGIPISECQREALRKYRTGKKLSPETRIKVMAGLKKAQQKNTGGGYKVQCLITNQVWNNRLECMRALNMNLKVFQQRIFKNVPIKGHHLQYIKN
jgi:hypothetical protein